MSEPLGYLLKATQHALRLAMDEVLREVDLTTPQYAALTALAECAPASNAELARACFVTPQTMHGITTASRRRAWVEEDVDASQGRVVAMRLTPTGRRLLARARAAVAPVEARMVEGMSAADQRTLRTLLERAFDSLASS